MGALSKHANILEFTLASLARRKARNLSLILVYTAVVALLASVMFFTTAIKREAASLLAESPEVVVQRMVGGRHDLIPITLAEGLAAIRGVTGAKPRLWGYYFDPAVGANYTLMAEEDHKAGIGNIVIGSAISRDRVAGVGDIFPFLTHEGFQRNLRITEVLPEHSEIVAADLVLMDEADLRAITGVPEGMATDIALSVRNPRELTTIARKVTEAFPGMRPIVRDEVLRTYSALFNWRGGMMVAVLTGALLAFVIFAWDKASGLSAEERREIGVLKALGWETSDVLMMKFWEGAAISLSAFLMGLVIAYLHVFFAEAALFEPALKGWSILYPRFELTPHIDYYQVATLFCLTVLPYTACTIVPSWRAATTDPDAVMRDQ